jgi:hypothetical protein
MKQEKMNSIVLDAMAADPDIDPPYDYTPRSTDDSNNGGYFNRVNLSAAGRREKLMTVQ